MEEFPKGAVGSETLRGLTERLRTYKSSGGADKENGFSLKECDGIDLCNDAVIESAKKRKKTAAVLVCLFEGIEGELRVILTKRSMKLSSHPGDVALPGGKMDECDANETATALREAMEEIGLDPSLVQVVSILKPFTSQVLTNNHLFHFHSSQKHDSLHPALILGLGLISQNLIDVVPVVGILEKMEEFNPMLNEDEVDMIFDVPLEMFLKDENHAYEERDWMGWKYTIHRFDYKAMEDSIFRIYGLTARILIWVASIVYDRSPSFDSMVLDFQRLQQWLSRTE